MRIAPGIVCQRQSGCFEIERVRRAHPARGRRVLVQKPWRHDRQTDAAVPAKPLVAAAHRHIGVPAFRIDRKCARSLGDIDHQQGPHLPGCLPQAVNIHPRSGGKLHIADGHNRCALVDTLDQGLGQVVGYSLIDELQFAAMFRGIGDPRSRDSREIGRHGQNPAARGWAKQVRQLTEHFTSARYNGQAVRLAGQDGGGLFPKQREKGHLIAVGHFHIPVTPNIVQERMHRRDGRLANQSKRGLVKVNTVREAAVLRTIRQGRNHRVSYAVGWRWTPAGRELSGSIRSDKALYQSVQTGCPDQIRA